MKIAIFGDSWAKQLGEADELNSTLAWWEILAKKYEVENFGLSGSSTYYSYNNFQRLHSTFDKIIFIASLPGRLHLPMAMEFKSNLLGSLKRHQVTSLSDAENSLSFLIEHDPQSVEDINKLKIIIGYYTYVMNIPEQDTINRLYLDSVRNIRPADSLAIESFPALYNISKFETDYWGIDLVEKFSQGYTELRKCHMSAENNLMFANKIENWLVTGEYTLSRNDGVRPLDNWQKYFVPQRGLNPRKS
jgi:hypothetical protein